MTFPKYFAAVTLCAAATLPFAGCEKSHSEMRPDMDRVMSGDSGPQSADLREMASRLAPQVLQCRDIVENPYRAVIVCKSMDNQTSSKAGQSMNIYLKKLAGDLGSFAASDRVSFVEEAAVTNNMIAQEIGNTNPDPTEDAARTGQTGGGVNRRLPQYFLYGTVYDLPNARTNFYLFQFKLTKTNGEIVWTGQYEVRTLN